MIQLAICLAFRHKHKAQYVVRCELGLDLLLDICFISSYYDLNIELHIDHSVVITEKESKGKLSTSTCAEMGEKGNQSAISVVSAVQNKCDLTNPELKTRGTWISYNTMVRDEDE